MQIKTRPNIWGIEGDDLAVVEDNDILVIDSSAETAQFRVVKATQVATPKKRCGMNIDNHIKTQSITI